MPGNSVGEVLNNLEAEHAGLKARICDANGEVRRFINLYLNQDDVRALKGLHTEVKSGDSLSIIPAIAGGRS